MSYCCGHCCETPENPEDHMCCEILCCCPGCIRDEEDTLITDPFVCGFWETLCCPCIRILNGIDGVYPPYQINLHELIILILWVATAVAFIYVYCFPYSVSLGGRFVRMNLAMWYHTMGMGKIKIGLIQILIMLITVTNGFEKTQRRKKEKKKDLWR